MKILLSLAAIALAAVLIVSATMGAETLVPGGDSGGDKNTPRATVAGQKGKPRILAAGLSPLVIKGTGFVPGENVTVRMVDGAAKAKQVTKASAQGAFTVRLTTRADRCNGMTVIATGDKGSRTAFQFAEFLCASAGANG
jgi:hypothetical protein